MLKVSGGLDRRQLSELKRELAKRDLPQRKRQRLLWRIAKHGIITAAKRNQRLQQSPDGTPWPKRKQGKQKMLRGLPKLLAVREMPEREAVVVYLKGAGGKALSAGVLGNIHAQGATTTVSAASLAKPDQSEQATRKQASALRKLGYKRREGGRWVKASASWITQNLSRAQAGVVIRKLSGEAPKTTWKIVLPARAFLGVSDAEFNKIMARQLQAIDFGWQVKASDIKGKS